MQFPKKVIICGRTYTVKTCKKTADGTGYLHEQKIIIGTKGLSDERQFDTFLHEVAELVACDRQFRYGYGGSEGSIFVMNHKEFEHFMTDLAATLWPIIKIKSVNGGSLIRKERK